MDFEHSEERLGGSSRNAVFKTPMTIDRKKLHPFFTVHESSGYHSSPDLNSTAGSLPCRTRMNGRLSGFQSGLLMPDVHSSECQLSVSQDSGIGSESSFHSLKDSFLGDHECPVSSGLVSNTTSPETLPSLSEACSHSALDRSLWQSTPVVPEVRNIQPSFTDGSDFEPSPTKRRRPSHKKLTRDIFRCSRKRAPPAFRHHLLVMPSTSAAEQPQYLGREKVDFLLCLGNESNHLPALDTILGYLEPADLCRASIVSSSWKKIIDNLPEVYQRKRNYIDDCLQIKENLHQSTKKTEGILPFRGQLIAIQNLSRTEENASPSPRSPPVSPSKVRFNLYLKEGRKLESGETLMQCPRCQLPSRRETERSAICTRRGCQYHFCILCLCKFHAEKPCPVSSVRLRKRPTPKIGSRECRRNLQRL